MKRKNIWIAAAVSFILLSGCSQGEKLRNLSVHSIPVTDAESYTAEQGRGRPESDSPLSFSEDKTTSPELTECENETSESRALKPQTPLPTESQQLPYRRDYHRSVSLSWKQKV